MTDGGGLETDLGGGVAVIGVLVGSGDDCLGGGGLELDRENVVLTAMLSEDEGAAWREGEILNCSDVSDLGRGTGLKVDDDVSKEEVRLSPYCWSCRRCCNKTPVTKIDI